MDLGLRSGALVSVIVVGTAFEAFALWLFNRRTGRGVPPAQFILNLLSGLALLCALREALVGGDELVIYACLTLALVFHVSDMARRWIR